MWETWVRSLGWEDPLEKGTATYSSILAWRIPWTVYNPWGHKEFGHDWVIFTGLASLANIITLLQHTGCENIYIKALKSFPSHPVDANTNTL